MNFPHITVDQSVGIANKMGHLDTIAIGDELSALTIHITRADLVKYAGASGDFNPIHWSDRFANSVGLPGVIAHGMFTMAIASRIVTQWLGDPAAIVEYSARFTRPVVVPDDEHGAKLVISGKVSKILPDGRVKIAISAVYDSKTVLGGATIVVKRSAVS